MQMHIIALKFIFFCEVLMMNFTGQVQIYIVTSAYTTYVHLLVVAYRKEGKKTRASTGKNVKFNAISSQITIIVEEILFLTQFHLEFVFAYLFL